MMARGGRQESPRGSFHLLFHISPTLLLPLPARSEGAGPWAGGTPCEHVPSGSFHDAMFRHFARESKHAQKLIKSDIAATVGDDPRADDDDDDGGEAEDGEEGRRLLF